DPEPAATDPAATEPAPQPERVAVDIRSKPAGASVFLVKEGKADVLLCVTGAKCKVAIPAGAATLVFRLPGYLEHRRDLTLTEDFELEVELEPKPTRKSRPNRRRDKKPPVEKPPKETEFVPGGSYLKPR
ncbi:MAG: hypothetical protein KJO07_25000, partial [Deltaproteobacteria bacterium]|nr:hypothetical protein [Deltaproteobacteria bacterium]